MSASFHQRSDQENVVDNDGDETGQDGANGVEYRADAPPGLRQQKTDASRREQTDKGHTDQEACVHVESVGWIGRHDDIHGVSGGLAQHHERGCDRAQQSYQGKHEVQHAQDGHGNGFLHRGFHTICREQTAIMSASHPAFEPCARDTVGQ